MAYVDWSDPEFPRIRDAPDGDSWVTLTWQLIRHHVEIVRAHCRAIERLLDESNS